MNPLIGRMAIRASAAALLSVAATAAMAQTAPSYNCPTSQAKSTVCINGGGSTLAANVYNESTSSTPPGLANGIFTGVALKSGGTLGISYEKAGSGAGQQAFANNDPSLFGNGDPVDHFVVHYGASDAFITNTCSTPATPGCYLGQGASLPNSVGGGPFIQIPMFATPITIPVVNKAVTADGKGSTGVKGSVTLTDNDLCGVFSGLITEWGATSAGKKNKKLTGTIHVYWRADNGGSGTTFLLTQHLAAVCTTSNTLTNVTFSATTKFATLFSKVVTITTPPETTDLWTIPVGPSGQFANFVAVKGSNGIADGMLLDTTDSAIGYVSPDYTSIAKTPSISDNSAVSYSNLLVADVVNATDGKAYAPDTTSLLLAMQNPGSKAVNGTPPALTTANAANAANQLNWVPQIALPARGYPIMGYTNLLVAQCYKSKVVANGVKAMIVADVGPTSKTLLTNNGFQPTIGGNVSGWGKAIIDAFISNVGGLNLNVQNATVCKNYTGR